MTVCQVLLTGIHPVSVQQVTVLHTNKRNLANNTGGAGEESTMGITNFHLRKSQVRKWWKIGLNQTLI